MSAVTQKEQLTSPESAAKLSDQEWVALHVPRFAQASVAGAYVEYAAFMKSLLQLLTAKAAPLAIVETRVKSIDGFAEKILRKRKVYETPNDPLPPDPLVRITDLCGGRVICQTGEHVRAVCQLIEQVFDIDWRNSEDVSQRLKPTEFGYRSVHYIVQVNPENLAASGIDIQAPPAVLGAVSPDQPEIKRLKAEIQVRTLLEHASSDLGHDSIYKSDFKVPDRIKRHYAAIAAVLESTDHEIELMRSALGELRSNFGAWHKREEVIKEIDYADVLLSLSNKVLSDEKKIPIAVRAAQLALSIGNHEKAKELLAAYESKSHEGVQRVYGQTLTELYWLDPHRIEFRQGVKHLQNAALLDPTNVETIILIAESMARANNEADARNHFVKAIAIDGTEPWTLSRYLEFETAHQRNDSAVKLAAPMIQAGIVRAERQIEARANLSTAWSALAVLYLFSGKPFKSLYALAQVIRLCNESPDASSGAPGHLCAAGRALSKLMETIRRLGNCKNLFDGYEWFERFVLIAAAARIKNTEARRELEAMTSWHEGGGPIHFQWDQKTVILAGGCSEDVERFVETLQKPLLEGCKNLCFVLISGGTCSGISRLAGDLAAASNNKCIRAYGYLPHSLPRYAAEDKNHDRFVLNFSSNGTDFTPLEPLQAWTDLICADVDPASVRLLCYAPGEIARAECEIALALGARVGYIVDEMLPKERQFDAASWEGAANLLLLPKDAMTIRAFLQIDHQPISEADRETFEPAAKMAHEEYVKSAIPKEASLQPWNTLDETLKLSNYNQVLYWMAALQEYGLGVRPMTKENETQDPLNMREALPKIGDRDPIEELAMLEHGRWNIERLGHGWQYASEKDVSKKRSPYLIPWEAIPKNIQQYDIDAIEKLPSTLRQAGLEVYKL